MLTAVLNAPSDANRYFVHTDSQVFVLPSLPSSIRHSPPIYAADPAVTMFIPLNIGISVSVASLKHSERLS